jgi:hypothetical protein
MSKLRKPFLIACAAGVLAFAALAACAPLPAAPVSPIATPNPSTVEAPLSSPTQTPQETVPATATQSAQSSAQELAAADLATHLSIATDAISVVSVEQVDWNDASLGCPEPDMMYAQVITPGYRIVLEADGQTFEYHTGSGTVKLCQP